MPRFRTLDDLDVAGKRVLVRADLNVPVRDGKVTDATRIERLAPTIARDRRARRQADRDVAFRPAEGAGPVAIAAPAGRAAVARDRRPHRCVSRPIASDPRPSGWSRALRPGEIALLENLRFHPGEEKNDPDFARQLAALGDLYVDDAFSAAHRAHASIEALAHLLPAAAGKNMQAELDALGAALENPTRPVIALVGGAKVSTKLDLLAIHHRQGRSAGDRRRDGEHLSLCAGTAGRPLAVRAGPGRHGARDPGAGQGARLRDHPARGRGDRRKARTGGRDPHGRDQRRAGDRDDPRYRPAERRSGSAGRSKPRRRWCGTGRSARSRRRPSTAARSRSQERSPS